MRNDNLRDVERRYEAVISADDLFHSKAEMLEDIMFLLDVLRSQNDYDELRYQVEELEKENQDLRWELELEQNMEK